MNIWLDGQITPADAARIDPADRGFLLGDGLFETMCVSNGKACHQARHLTRLQQGAATLEIPLPPDIPQAIAAILQANACISGSLRLTLSAGPAPRGLIRPASLQPTLLITTAPAASPSPPARLIIAQTTRRNQHSPLSRLKSLNYGDQMLARREAQSRGADDALLLNTDGALVCASAANLLLHDGHRWLTPPTASGALPGTRRAILIEAGLLREQTLVPADLTAARQLLLLNALGAREVIAAQNHGFVPNPALIAPLLRTLRDADITSPPF